jgi:hypothetical protein
VKPYTVELAYTVLSTATVQVQAESFEDACAKALTDPPWEDFEDNSESTGEPFVCQIAEGDVDLCEEPNAIANVPLPYTDEADRLRAERDQMIDVVQTILEAADTGRSASGLDEVEAVAAARAALREFRGARAPAEQEREA